jgi:hypothetical protein
MPNRSNYKPGNVPKIEQTAFHRGLPIAIFPELHFWDDLAFRLRQILSNDLPDFERQCVDADPPGLIRAHCGKVQSGDQGSQCLCDFVLRRTGFSHEDQNKEGL